LDSFQISPSVSTCSEVMIQPSSYGRRWRGPKRKMLMALLLIFSTLASRACAIHHMRRPPLVWVNQRDDSRPLSIVNQCPETIWPGILTSAGTGPGTGGFSLAVGGVRNMTVSGDWQGRVWARTNCTFNLAGTGASNSGPTGGGIACTTGDCGGIVNCQGTVSLSLNIANHRH
jgi:Thaumatin family